MSSAALAITALPDTPAPTPTPRRAVRVGDVFGRWAVLAPAETRPDKHRRWRCRCGRCGAERDVLALSLLAGTSRSCGCWKADKLRRHGLHGHPAYRCWRSMIVRCYDRRHRDYAWCGGRGVTVCRGWRESLAAFLADVGVPPSPGHVFGRADFSGGYRCGRCQECLDNGLAANWGWFTPEEVALRKSQSRKLSCDGETHTLTGWSRRTGLSRGAISLRLARGLTVAEALHRPRRGSPPGTGDTGRGREQARVERFPAEAADPIRTSQRQDLSGMPFGGLRVTGPPVRKGRHVRYLCRCDCGRTVTAYGYELLRGLVDACGRCRNGRRPAVGSLPAVGPRPGADRGRGRDRARVAREFVGLADLVALVLRLHTAGRLGPNHLAAELPCGVDRARRLLLRPDLLAALSAVCPDAHAALQSRIRLYAGRPAASRCRRAWKGSRQELAECKAQGLDPAEWVEDFCGPADLPESPTDAVPGSEEKIAVLAARYARREALHHPLDAGAYSPLASDLPPGPEPPRVETADERRRRLLGPCE